MSSTLHFKKNVFTIDEIALHFLNQVILADANFQLNQREAWRLLGKSDEMYNGFSNLSSLFLSEIDYAFEITPAKVSFWDKVKILFGRKLKNGVNYYSIAKIPGPTENNLKITITIKRESPGKYDSSIKTMPETNLKSAQINVINFPQ